MFFFYLYGDHLDLHVLTHSFPTRRSSDLLGICNNYRILRIGRQGYEEGEGAALSRYVKRGNRARSLYCVDRKSTRLTPVTNAHLVCRLLLEKKNNTI